MRFLTHIIFFLSGVAGLVYEVSWSRQIGVIVGQTAEAAALVLASYFFGMGLGAWGATRIRTAWPLRAYGLAEIVTAIAALSVPALLESVDRIRFVPGFFAVLAILPATAAMGATLPFMVAYVSKAGGRVSSAYAANVLGAFVGIVVTTFYLIPSHGVARSGYVAAAISAGCGLIAWALRGNAILLGGAPIVSELPNHDAKLFRFIN